MLSLSYSVDDYSYMTCLYLMKNHYELFYFLVLICMLSVLKLLHCFLLHSDNVIKYFQHLCLV